MSTRSPLVSIVALVISLGLPLRGDAQPDPDYLLAISLVSGVAGSDVELSVTLDDNGSPLSGWAWGVSHDAGVAEIVDVQLGETTLTVNGGGPPVFYTITLLPGAGWTVGAVVDNLGQYVLGPGTGLEMNVATYQLVGPENAVTSVEFTDDLGQPPVVVTLVDASGNAIEPQTVAGSITIDPQLFRRGDADANGSVSGLLDGFFLLSYQFVPDSPPPSCWKSADADDDGLVHGLIDGLYVLNYQFVPGAPPPPAPGPFACDADPTPDGLGCSSYPSCP